MAALDSPAPRTGLTFDQLAARAPESTTFGLEPLKTALRTESSAGRVVVDHGVYQLAPGSFEPAVLDALRSLNEPVP